MNPTVWIYGGVHHDPGTRKKFLAELAKQETVPHFIAVEWEKPVFENFVKWRPWVAERLSSSWNFLAPEDCQELSLALAWEGDTYAMCFPSAELLWLETGFQEAKLKLRNGDEFVKTFAQSLLYQLCNPGSSPIGDPLSKPTSKKDLVDCVWKKAWLQAFEDNNFDRDTRWANEICTRTAGLNNGWIAVVVGWAHADPSGDNRRLRSILLSKGYSVHSVRLGP